MRVMKRNGIKDLGRRLVPCLLVCLMLLSLLPAPTASAATGVEYNVVFDANGGEFNYGEEPKITTNTLHVTKAQMVSYAYSPNVNSSGYASSTYTNYVSTYSSEIYMPGATDMEVQIWWAMETISYDWVQIQGRSSASASWTTYTYDRNGKAVGSSGKIGGTAPSSYTSSNSNRTGSYTQFSSQTYHFATDRLRFYFRTDVSVVSYGYFAKVTAGVSSGTNSITGEYKTPTINGNSQRFLGWATSRTATTPNVTLNNVNFSDLNNDIYKLSAGTTLYAVWEPVYTLTLDANGGQLDNGDSQLREPDLVKGARLEIPANPFFKYLNDNPNTPSPFWHWNTNANNTGTTYEPGQVLNSGFSADTTLYAIWKDPDYYTVHFEPNGGTGSMSNQRAKINAAYTPTDASFFRLGYRFKNWNTQADGLGTSYGTIPANTYTVLENVTLYAQWERSEDSGGLLDGGMAFSLKAGEQATFEGLPAGTGYQVWEETPAGWVLQYEVDSTGTVPANDTAAAYFKNNYAPTQTSASIKATKTLDGGIPGAAYSFTLHQTGVPSGATAIADRTAECNDMGAVSFGSISYSRAGTYVYTIRENAGTDESLDYDGHTETVTVVVGSDPNGEALIADVQYDSDGAVFANTHKKGSLRILNTVTEGSDREQSFLFRLTLTAADGSPLVLSGPLPDGLSEAPEGGYSFTLRHGESVELNDLPYGTRYSVQEIDLPGGWSVTGINGSGTIPAGGQVLASFTNTYTPGSVAGAYVTLMAHKLLEGENLASGQFSFALEKKDASNTGNDGWIPVEEMPNGARDTAEEALNPDPATAETNPTVPNPWLGMGPVVFTELSFTEPTEALYRVREKIPASPDARLDYAADAVYAKVSVTDHGDGTLDSALTWYRDEACTQPIADAEPVFVNRVKTSSLTVTNILRNAESGSENTPFSFTITFTDATGEAMILTEPLPEGMQPVEGTPGSYSFTLKDGEQITVPGLPYGCSYTVTEGLVEGFTLFNKTNDSATMQGEDITCLFVNTGYTAASVEIPVVDTYYGDSIADNQFYILLEKFDDPEMSGKSESFLIPVPAAAANAAGVATSRFTLPLSYSYSVLGGEESRTIYYRLTEVQGDSDAILYSGATYTGRTVITNEGGGVISANFSLDDSVREAAFNNYRLLEVHVDNTVNGNLGDPEQPFPFTVTLSELPDPQECPDLDWSGIVQPSANMGTDNGNSWSFTLKHGESAEIRKIPYGTSFTVTETPDDYKPSLTVLSENADGSLTETYSRSGQRAASRSDSLKKTQYLHFTNTRDEPIDTGVVLGAGGGLAALVGLLGYAGVRGKRRLSGGRHSRQRERNGD